MNHLDGKRAFELTDTYGVPLSVVVELAAVRGARIGWIGYLNAAAIAGWTVDRALREIEEAGKNCTVQSECEQALAVVGRLRSRMNARKENEMAKSTAHPGFKSVAASVARKQGVSPQQARAIVAAGARKASPAARQANPRLNRVKR